MLGEDFDIRPGEDLSPPSSVLSSIRAVGLLISGILGLFGLVLWLRDRHRLRRLSPAARDYLWMNRAARLLGIRLPASWTPMERARHLAALAPEMAETMRQIAERYTAVRFGRRPLPPGSAPRGWWLAFLFYGLRGRLRSALARWISALRSRTLPTSPPFAR
jgi:hypothetical protein